ncbi:MAG: hypothetical protein DSY78_15575 [Chloroflexi bacterium]|nr:MAG: hypothetical protein DSY78_15575 [Chloroflexota bacterium]
MNFLKIEEFTSIEAWRASFIEFLAAALFVFLGAGPLVRHGVPDRRRTNGPTAIHHCVGSRTSDSVPSVRHCQYIGWAHEPRGDICGCGEQKDQRSARTDVRLRAVGWGSVGALLLLATIPDAADTNLGAHALGPDVSISMGLVMEIVVTFVLVFVIFATAVDPGGIALLAPLAIGLAVVVDHMVAIPITGASMNPARSFGPALVSGEWANHWIYWLGPMIGGVLAGVMYQVVFINRPR